MIFYHIRYTKQMKKFLIITLTNITIFISSLFCFWLSIEVSNSFSDLFNKWYESYNNWDYQDASEYFQKVIDLYPNDPNNKAATKNLALSYFMIWYQYSESKSYEDAIKYYEKADKIYPNDFATLANLWSMYAAIHEFDTALSYFKKAKKYIKNSEDEEYINERIENINTLESLLKEQEKEENLKKLAKTNDTYNYLQYYLQWHNIYDAWWKLSKYKNTVTIAVIDDWIDMTHPDLINSLRTNSGEIYGNGIDDDKNWFIDDVYGWNFAENSNKMKPTWEHGTMVAWILWATTNNSEWIAGIVPNVKIMPIIIFWNEETASSSDTIKAINYAIDNGADIINLSLWWEVNEYTKVYDEVLQKAYNKWVIVVIAAWNGVVTPDSEEKIWINTSVNKISLVCNESWNVKSVIGVWSLWAWWKISDWSSYWDCVDFYAYGEQIFSTSYEWWELASMYAQWNWTSFATPIVAWIIGLWYNKYGKQTPDTVYEALSKSLKWLVINAADYIDNLWNEYQELDEAISWMFTNWLTIFNNKSDFMYQNWLRRDEAAKFFVNYAKEVIWLTPDYSNSDCIFDDLDEARDDLKDIVIESCQLGLFQWSNWKFMPTEWLTNAQTITVFMRLLEWKKDETWSHYANEYFKSANNLWLLNRTPLEVKENFDKFVSRWSVAKMLYRWQKLYYNN